MDSLKSRIGWAHKVAFIFIVGLLSFAAVAVHTNTVAFADSVHQTGLKNQGIFSIQLSGASSPGNYNVTAQNPVGTASSLQFAFTTSGNVNDGFTGPRYVSNVFNWVGNPGSCVPQSHVSGQYQWKFIVKDKSGNTVGTADRDYCGNSKASGYANLITVPVSSGSSKTGNIPNGTLTYIAPDDTTQPFRSNTKASLKGPAPNGKSYTISVNDKGQFSIFALPVGTYTLSAQYSATSTAHHEKAGFLYTITKSVNINGGTNKLDVTAQGQGGGGSTCTDGSAPASDGTCPNGSGSSGKDGNLDCGAGSWNWLVCTGAVAIKDAALKMDSIINDMLTVSTNDIFGGSNNAYHVAWNSFRILATALIVIAGLIMVASEAMGFELLDAYTIRKTLPRLLIAAIFISLSWPLLQFVIDFFNTVGRDIENLIAAPFNGLAQNQGGTIIALTNPLTLIFAATGLFFVFGPAIFTFLITGFLAIMIALLVLAIRQTAIIVLVIVAPVAIACYILPNTQKVWNFWRENFLGLMMMYPIITGLIAAGRVMSAAAGSNKSGNPMYGFLSLIAYFIPYFLIPLAFRLASGVISNISGMVNDRSKGAFDRLKKRRGEAAARNVANMKSGTRFNNRALNAATSRATTRGFGLGARGRSAYNQKMDLAAAEHAKSAGGQAVQHNDDALRALTYGSALEARRALEAKGWDDKKIDSAIGAAKASGGFGRARQVFAAQQLAATGTGYENYQDVAETIARVSHGNQGQIASLAGNINSTTKQAGRYDLAAGFDTLNRLSRAESEGTMSAAQRQAAYNEASVKASRGVDAVTLMRGKPAQTKNLVGSLESHFKAQYALGMAGDAAAMDEALQTAAQIKQLGDAKSYGSVEQQSLVNDLDRKTRHLRSGPGTLEDLVRPATVDPTTKAVTPAGPLRARWEQLSPTRPNANDPNLPT